MASVQVENLVPGMVLKRSVTDRSGRLLLPEGATLEAKHLNIFRMWGVLDVDVTDEGDAEPVDLLPEETCDPELLARVSAEIGALFVHNDPQHPAVKELLRSCIKRRVAHEA